MRRTLARLVTATFLALAGTLLSAGPAAAVAPPPSGAEHDCRLGSTCHPGQHRGDDLGRNIGG